VQAGELRRPDPIVGRGAIHERERPQGGGAERLVRAADDLAHGAPGVAAPPPREDRPRDDRRE
jgi:hypothetical protein